MVERFAEIGRDWGAPFAPQSTSVDGRNFPPSMRTEDGMVPLLIDRCVSAAQPPASLSLPGGDAWLLELVALTPNELEHILMCGEAARNEIARRLRSHPFEGMPWASSARRPSVVSTVPPTEQCSTMEQAIADVRAWPEAHLG